MDASIKTTAKIKQAVEIFEEHSNTILTAIRFHINNQSNVDDIYQDFFLSLIQKPVPDRNKNVRAFINRAIRNDVLDAASQTRSYYLRNQKYAKINSGRFKLKTPEKIISHAEEIDQLFNIIESQLLKHEAEAIIQKYRYGKDIAEIANVMGINRRSVSCYICTGLQKLRKLFQHNRSQQINYLV